MYIGVDLGTSSIKLLLADNTGNIIDSSTEEYPLYLSDDGYSEQDPDDWWNKFIVCLSKLNTKHNLKTVKGISFSGQMHGLVMLDNNDCIIRKAILWNDSRSYLECDEINKDKVIEYTGNMALTGFTAPKLLWIKKHEPENFHKISKIMLPKDYLVYKLTSVFASDVSDLSGTLFFNVKDKKYSKEMLNICGINENNLPKIYESGDVITNVSNKEALSAGLSDVTKVIIGGGDQAMGAIGTGTINDKEMSISLGTSGVIFVNSTNYVDDKKATLHSFCNANHQFHAMGVTLSCALSTKWWVKDILKSNYAEAFDGIKDVEITKLVFLPYLNGERSPINDPFAKGGFYGINASYDQKDMTKAVIEGVCFSLKDCLTTVEDMGITPSSARVIGGGTKSNDWLQILADILEIEIRQINTSEGGGLGAIILAMVACNEFSSVKEACDYLVKDKNIFYPRKQNYEIYRQKFIKFKKLYYATKSI